MDYQTIKKVSDINIDLKTAVFEIDTRDGSPRQLRIIDGSGKALLVRGDYGVTIEQTAPPKMVKKYSLAGAINGATIVPIMFSNKHEAEAKKLELGGDLEISEIEIEDK